MTRFGKLSFAEAIALIEIRMREAVKMLERCSLERHDIPDKVRSAWPDVVRQMEDAYGYEGDPDHPEISKDTDKQRRRREEAINRAVPSPAELDRMDRALQLLWWVPNGSRGLVGARVAGATWNALSIKMQLPTIEVRTRYKLGLEAIFDKLMEKK